MEENIFELGFYRGQYNNIIGEEFPEKRIVRSEGLMTHIQKRHPNCVKYFEKISEIISNPDYVGVNPKEKGSFELVKIYDDNILIGIKLDIKNDYFYVATLHEIKQSKLERRIFSGRLKKVKD